MKIGNILLAVMFLLFAFVQINDPDPTLWILIYGIMAVVCILAAFKTYYPLVLILLLLGFGVYGYVLFPGVKEWFSQDDLTVLFDDIAKMDHIYIEEAREFLGLLICIIVIVVQLISARRSRKAV